MSVPPRVLKRLERALSRIMRNVHPDLRKALSFPTPLTERRLPESGRRLDVVRSYTIGYGVMIDIRVGPEGTAYYVVNEPIPDPVARKVYEFVMMYLYAMGEPFRPENVPPSRLVDAIRPKVEKVLREFWLGELSRYSEIVAYYIARQTTLGDLYPLLLDENLEEIELGKRGTRVIVIHREVREYGALFTNIVMRSPDEGRDLAQRIAAFCNAELSAANPRISVSMPEFGYRFTANYGLQEPPSFNIRKYPREPFTVPLLVSLRTISPLIAAYVWLINEAKLFWVVAGTSGAGKNTLLNALMMLIDPVRSKVVAAMDIEEFNLQPRPDIDDRLYSRFIPMIANSPDELFDIALTALRYVPDYLVINEVRGKEIKALERAVASGDGVATTIHAGNPHEVLTAIRTVTAEDEFKRLVSSLATVIMMNRVGKRLERKVVSVNELLYDFDTGHEEWIEVARYAGGEGESTRFEPETPDELFERSHVLKRVAYILRVPPQFIRDELELRTRFIEECVRESVYGFEEFGLRIFDFYRRYYDRLSRAQEEAAGGGSDGEGGS